MLKKASLANESLETERALRSAWVNMFLEHNRLHIFCKLASYRCLDESMAAFIKRHFTGGKKTNK